MKSEMAEEEQVKEPDGLRCSMCQAVVNNTDTQCYQCGSALINLPEQKAEGGAASESQLPAVPEQPETNVLPPDALVPPQDLVAKVTEGFESGFVGFEAFGKGVGGYVVSPEGAVVAMQVGDTRVKIVGDVPVYTDGKPADKIFEIRLEESRKDWQERLNKGETYEIYATRPTTEPALPQAADAQIPEPELAVPAPAKGEGESAAPGKMRKRRRAPASTDAAPQADMPAPQTPAPADFIAVTLAGNTYYVQKGQEVLLQSQFGVLEKQVKEFAAALGQKRQRIVAGADDLLKEYHALGRTPNEISEVLQDYSAIKARFAEMEATLSTLRAKLDAAGVTAKGLEETIKNYEQEHPKALVAKDKEYQKRAEALARQVEEARGIMKAGLETQRQRWEQKLEEQKIQYMQQLADANKAKAGSGLEIEVLL